MKVKEILDFDSFSNEQDVLVTDGEYTLMCYNMGIQEFSANMQIQNNLSAFMAHNIYRADNNFCYVEKLSNGYYAYELCGELINREKNGGTVKIGEIFVDITDYIPNDIQSGEYICFKVDRIDLFK